MDRKMSYYLLFNPFIFFKMKQKLFFIAVAAMGMASCSQDESTGINNGNAIDFRAALGTRAVETTTANLDKIVVTAIDKNDANYFTDAEFTKNDAFFTSTPAYYWPGDGSDLSFYAYSPAASDLGATVTINSTTKTLADFSPASAIADQKDFVTANATGNKTNESTGVALLFKHQLSQVEIKAKNGNEGYVYKVTGVRIGQPVSKGTFDFGTSGWTLTQDKTNYLAEYDQAITLGADAQGLMGDGGNAMLLPQQLVAWTPDTDMPNANKGAYLAVKVNITTKDGTRVYPAESVGEYDWAAVAVGTNWQAGKKYIYTLDFSEGAGKVDPEKEQPEDPTVDPFDPGEDILGSPIKFTVEVSEWEDAGAQDITM